MPLTRKFIETVKARANNDPAFRAALFEEALQALFEGDLEGSRELLRDCINATVGFQAISERSGVPIKSVMRMFGPFGNPQLDNFVSVVCALQQEGCFRASAHVEIHDRIDVLSVQSSSLGVSLQYDEELAMEAA